MRRLAPLGAALAVSAALLAAGCGGGGDSADVAPAATAPAAAVPVAVASVAPGQPVVVGPNTPKNVARALAGSKVVVVAFLVKGTADDDDVAAAIRSVRGDARWTAGTQFFVYDVGKDRFGDLADLLGATSTPAVAVIGRDRILTNMWTGLVDAEILRQSIADAADTTAKNRSVS